MINWGSQGYGMWNTWGMGGIVMMIFFWVLIIMAAVLIFRYFTFGQKGV